MVFFANIYFQNTSKFDLNSQQPSLPVPRVCRIHGDKSRKLEIRSSNGLENILFKEALDQWSRKNERENVVDVSCIYNRDLLEGDDYC